MKVKYSTNVLTRLAQPNKKHLAALFVAVTASVLIAGLAIFYTARAATTLETVTPGDVRPIAEAVSGDPGWYVTTKDSGTAEVTSTQPYNSTGSAEFSVEDSGSYAELNLLYTFGATRLADLDRLSYQTYQTTNDPQAVALQINVDTDVTDASTAWQGRLVYEPYLNTDLQGDPVTGGEWQNWQVLEPDSVLWMSWSSPSNPCKQSAPCTYEDILELYPNIGFNNSPSSASALTLKAGSGWSEFVGFADGVAVTYDNGDATIWDFEVLPTSKDQCKNGGWQTFGNTFKNQGACVSYVAKQQ